LFFVNSRDVAARTLALRRSPLQTKFEFPYFVRIYFLNDPSHATFGIEEEFFLTDLSTRHVAGHPPAALFHAAEAEFGASVSHELLRSQIELISPILPDCATAKIWLRDSRARLARIAERFGLGIVAAGTHPLAQWREQTATELPRYEQLLDDFQIVAQRNMLCGVHVHVAVPDDIDRVTAMNRVMPWLPLLLSLSASSPFWTRRRSGLMSYRQAVYDEWPRTGIPDYFENERSYRDFVDFMVQTGSLKNESYLWWAIRPSMRFPTLELRIADACPRAEDALCIAAIFRAMLRQIQIEQVSTQPASGGKRNEMTRLLIEENRWRAKRFGTHATFLHQPTRRNLSIATWLEMAQERFGETAANAGDDWVWAHARGILEQGGSADRQLLAYAAARGQGANRTSALREVVDLLLRETMEL
jgi:glutamate---cysteine ligase / carboxylate-amine ligase